MADETSSSIPDALYEHFPLCPFVNPTKAFTAFHKARLAHDFMCSIGTNVLPHFLIEVYLSKTLQFIVLFDSHLDLLPFQVLIVKLVFLGSQSLLCYELLDLAIPGIISLAGVNIVHSD